MSDTPTPLVSLRSIRDGIVDDQKLTLRVQRWDDPEILITYKLVDGDAYAKSMRSMYEDDAKARTAEELAEVAREANTDLLVRACTGVRIKGSQIDRSFPNFDEELCEALDLELPSARTACQTLFIADGDLLNHAQRLVEWSGYGTQTIAEAFSGE